MIVDGRVVNRSNPDAPLALLQLAAAVEACPYPLAQAIVIESKQRGLAQVECAAFNLAPAKVRAVLNGRRIAVGNAAISLHETSPFRTASPGRSPLCRTWKDMRDRRRHRRRHLQRSVPGAIAIADVLRADAVSVVQQLKRTASSASSC
jgi:cation transport ATPase